MIGSVVPALSPNRRASGVLTPLVRQSKPLEQIKYRTAVCGSVLCRVMDKAALLRIVPEFVPTLEMRAQFGVTTPAGGFAKFQVG